VTENRHTGPRNAGGFPIQFSRLRRVRDSPAARLPDDVPAEEKEQRRSLLEKLQTQIAGEINASLLGQTVEVLVEERQRGRWKGRTVTNKLVFFEDTAERRGHLVPVQITWTGPWSLVGQAVG